MISTTIEDLADLRLTDLPDRLWRRRPSGAERSVLITLEDADLGVTTQRIRLVATRQRCGWRSWMACGCGARRARLIVHPNHPKFVCRSCCRVNGRRIRYQSQVEWRLLRLVRVAATRTPGAV